jgi:hypothetical protein
MAATIRSRSRVLRPRVNPGDLYLSRVVKYIPTEVIMAYIASIHALQRVDITPRCFARTRLMALLLQPAQPHSRRYAEFAALFLCEPRSDIGSR